MLTFRIQYFLGFLILLAIEVFIALQIKDQFIRPYLGDVLVVILIYTFIRSFFKFSIELSMLIVFLFSFSVEFTQMFKLIELLKLQDCVVAHWVLGSSFNKWDFLAYYIGLSIVFIIEELYLTK